MAASRGMALPYRNPVHDAYFADPFVLATEDGYVAIGTGFWAPEVAHAEGRWWMYYSVGDGDVGHHLRVAVADDPTGPYVDQGVDLTPDERFAIDPSPFRADDGSWWLFFARDVLDDERVGTMLAVD